MSNVHRDSAIPIVGGILGAGVIFGLLFFRGSGKSGKDRAIHEITQAGGSVQVDESAPGKPVVRVDFEGFNMGDDGLARMRPHLEGLPRLRCLRITSMARVSDAGLTHLVGLTQLETIELYGNGITESGVKRLRTKLPNAQIDHLGPGLIP